MSTTPITDANEYLVWSEGNLGMGDDYADHVVSAEIARELENKLVEMTTERDKLLKAAQDTLARTQQTKYHLYVETDFDFSLLFHGDLYAGLDIDLDIANVKELDEILLQGPFGAPEDPEKRWEWDEAMAAIRANPEEDFNNTGGNRGVKWSVIQQLAREPQDIGMVK
jgi:hypothetical protein